MEHLEETLGLYYPHKVWKSPKVDVSSNKIEELDMKMDKLKRFMAQSSNFIDLGNYINGMAESEGAIMDIGLHP